MTGIDLRHKRVTIDGKNRCGNIQWVPFAEHPKGVNFIPRYNDTTEEPLDIPYDKTSVWYNPQIDGVGAGLVSRVAKSKVEEDPAIVQKKNAEDEAAGVAHKNEAKELARGNLSEEHKALSDTLRSKDSEVQQLPEVGHKEVISNAAAAALKAEQMENEIHLFPPLLRGTDKGIPKGRFHFTPIQLVSKHGVQHLPLQVQLSVLIMVIGIFAAVIVSVGNNNRSTSKSKKRG